jgi:UDP-glucose:(heptosyl)LPS alpha-1,3-glucosyltransferase
VKIALIILHADAARGGAERYTMDLAGSLGARGHSVSLLASSFQSDQTAGRRVVMAAAGATRTRRYLRFLDSVEAEIDPGQYDIVHAMLPVRRCDVYHPHAGIAVEAVSGGHLNKANAARQAIAWMGNRFNVRRNKFAKVEGELLRGGDPPVVLCLSRLIQSVVSRHYPGLPADRLVALFNGIDLKKFDPAIGRERRLQVRDRYGIDSSAVVGLMLAQDFERKGLGPAIEAMGKSPDAKLVLLVGGKPDPAKYRRLVDGLGLGRRVIFAGPVDDPAAFYQAADFFVLPTRFDPCSLVVLEALAMGLPVISTVRNGACEVMKNGVHGSVLADPDDTAALAEAMSTMTDAEYREKMADVCVQLRPHLSQTFHVDQLLKVYETVEIKRTAPFGDLARR